MAAIDDGVELSLVFAVPNSGDESGRIRPLVGYRLA
jgi:hypothetical protein